MKKENVKCSQTFKTKDIEERKQVFNKKWIGIIEQMNKNVSTTMFYNNR